MEEKQCFLVHELMNSLTIVLGECELLLLKAPEEGKERLQIIREQATHMAELIRHSDCPAEYDPHHDGLLEALFRSAGSNVKQ